MVQAVTTLKTERRKVESGPASGCASSGCGSRSDKLAHLPAAIRAKVNDHPCFSEDAHHHYARMHVAVAPACNIQCHYCNRKYDCSNESRPGVVSELLTPEQAVQKTLAVAAAIPQMSVLGIAGPGDPLANPERTLATFRALSEKAPDIKLCVSTNGLALPELVDEICQHNIDHVTITINCVDPEIGAKIYPWIFWNNRRIKGVKAARILIEQQQKGLAMLAERGVLVKVNSVLIPGVNDEHLKEVSRVVKAKGAFLHNVMPLIAEAEHGTFYGLMGQRGPTHDELQSLQEACSGDMAMMRHCRQCRADAVGMLGEDRGAEFSIEKIEQMDIDYAAAMERRATVHAEIEAKRQAQREASRQATQTSGSEVFVALDALTRRRPAAPSTEPNLVSAAASETTPLATQTATPIVAARTASSRTKAPTGTTSHPLRIAVASSGSGVINQHFGHAREFLVYEADAQDVRFIGTRRVQAYCTGDETCGEADSALAGTLRALEGCVAVLCSKIGIEPWDALEAAGIAPNGEHAMEPIETAVAAVYTELTASGALERAEPMRALSA
ncbi:nitrogenase cofactor biosynthesis protein NifB [Halochromatium roseum]|uniref:nitrogenase cofactor biosynthesis protein NifB n=1 Tax=Halochromatium roseum TaxID=391920 RepID=UPI001914B25A|nr:nitrogenase cofactor biosynthesis protein NifB [Halochromatium roseum]MBK5939031.1 nitrogenase cofactor biosynthesis protein NifB [Halochromatium roseum]